MADDITIFDFNNRTHLKNHLAYLVHCDSKDKYTNDDSVGNETYVLTEDANGKKKFDVYKWTDDFSERKNLGDKLYKMLSGDFSRLYYTRIECVNQDVFHWNNEMKMEIADYIKMFIAEGYEPLIIQIHDDQPELWCHFHVILRKI